MSKIILITGPSGAGKSTVSRNLVDRLSGEWSYINQDEIRQQVIGGYASADGQMHEWSNATRRQWEVSIPICTDIIKNYVKYDIGCIVDFFVYPGELDIWLNNLAELHYNLFVLQPTLDVLQDRNSNRPERSKLSVEKITENFELYNGLQTKRGTVIDNTNLSSADTAKKIKKLANITNLL